MSKSERAKDTRRKIEMGGLVVKANLDSLHEYNKDVLLGIFVDAYNKINHPTEGDHSFEYFRILGQQTFDAHEKEKAATLTTKIEV